MNFKKTSTTLEKKYETRLKKCRTIFSQSLKIMEKSSPEIRKNYEGFLIVKLYNKNKMTLDEYNKSE